MQRKTALKPVKQIAAHELVLDQLRRAIESGQFRPGDRLPSERDMAEQLDVSRTTVRSAVGILEREGHLSVRRGRGGGFMVQTPPRDSETLQEILRQSREEIRGAFDFRVIVESAAARLAAERCTQTEIINLRALLDGMGSALEIALAEQTAHHAAQFQSIDSAFHLGIAAAAKNPQLSESVMTARRQMWMPVGGLFGRLEENANDYHEELLNAIESGDGDGASSIMRAHIRATQQTLEKWLER